MEVIVLGPADARAADAARVGGKARGLWLLARAGFPVPAWRAVTADAFTAALAPLAADLSRALAGADLTDPEGARAASARCGEVLARLQLGAPLEAALGAAVVALGGGPLAVRSSAAVEDSAAHSFSGQFDTVLGVTGAAEVPRAVLAVWRSAFSARALHALGRAGLPLEKLAMAVVVQKMVTATIAGVAHSVDLTGQKLDCALIGVVHGAGEALVSGTDAGRTISVPHAICARRSVMDAAALQPLTPDQAAQLVATAVAAERAFGRPQDLEFAFDAAGLHVLQSRPLTRFPGQFPVDATAREDLLLWDSSNIAESYAGPTSPLTFSFIRQSYANVYRETGETLGLDLADVRDNEPTYQKLLGYFRGRVYYNLLSWYRLVLQLPGGDANARNMEAMMGVKEPLPIARGRAPSSAKKLRYALRLLWLYWRAPALVERFRTHFEDVYARHRAVRPKDRDLASLARTYRELERELKGKWAAPILADVFSMVFLGVVRALAKKYALEQAPGAPLVSELLAPREGSLATRPVVALEELADAIRARGAWRALFETATPAHLRERLRDDPELAPLAKHFEAYLDEYGDRFAGELKLEEPSLRDNPEWVLSLLKGHVVRGSAAARRTADRARAQEVEDRALAQLSGLRRRTFRWALESARRFIKARESMRYDRSRLFGLIRDLFRAIGERLFAAGMLGAADDVFYLTVEEALGWIEGTAVTVDLAAIARRRRADWDVDRTLPSPPERFWTLGAAHAWSALIPEAEPASPRAEGALSGLGCYPGVVTGVAWVVEDPARPGDLAGKILVARSNDPGWVPLYAGIAGLLLERGSVLSHAANMAREMGIPAILGIPGLLEHVRSGMRVRMDASAGTVEILESGASDAPAAVSG